MSEEYCLYYGSIAWIRVLFEAFVARELEKCKAGPHACIFLLFRALTVMSSIVVCG